MDYVIANMDEEITDTPYYRPETANEYYRVTKEILRVIDTVGYKEFYDINKSVK